VAITSNNFETFREPVKKKNIVLLSFFKIKVVLFALNCVWGGWSTWGSCSWLGRAVMEQRLDREGTAEHQGAEVLLVPALVLNQHQVTVNAVR